MIKSLRYLAMMLGKFGIKELRREHPKRRQPFPNPNNSPAFDARYSYGLGLKEAKDWVEAYLDSKA